MCSHTVSTPIPHFVHCHSDMLFVITTFSEVKHPPPIQHLTVTFSAIAVLHLSLNPSKRPLSRSSFLHRNTEMNYWKLNGLNLIEVLIDSHVGMTPTVMEVCGNRKNSIALYNGVMITLWVISKTKALGYWLQKNIPSTFTGCKFIMSAQDDVLSFAQV